MDLKCVAPVMRWLRFVRNCNEIGAKFQGAFCFCCFSDSFVQLDIFYSELKSETIIQTPAYDVPSFFGIKRYATIIASNLSVC